MLGDAPVTPDESWRRVALVVKTDGSIRQVFTPSSLSDLAKIHDFL
jgi:hypothetical protein